MTEINVTHDGWAICHNAVNILHIIPFKNGNVLMTGQPHVEKFDQRDKAELRFRELALSMNYTQERIDEYINLYFKNVY